MAIICHKPKGSCLTCNKRVYDEDYQGYVCSAQEDVYPDNYPEEDYPHDYEK